MSEIEPANGNAKAANDTMPALQEVEFALALSRHINLLQKDPAELRYAVYQLARVALLNGIGQADREQDARLAQALETAITGVERFAARQEDRASPNVRQSLNDFSPSARSPASDQALTPFAPPLIKVEDWHPRPLPPIVDVSPQPVEKKRSRALLWAMVGSGVGVVLILSSMAARQPQYWLASAFNRAAQDTTSNTAGMAWVETTTLRSSSSVPAPPTKPRIQDAMAEPTPDFPLPANYGSYAVDKGKLVELHLLEGTVPDKRVAIASPLQMPSQAVLSDGSPTFVLFRRDLASIPSDAIEVRVIAKISRTMKFDSTTKSSPGYAAENDLWSVRGISYKVKSAPVPGNPEMIAIQLDSPAVLPPGRYALVVKRQGFDFTIAGDISDPTHCLERTEAANGMFYSPCKGP